MAGFAADVMCSCSRSRSAADSPSLLGPGSGEKKAERHGREFRLSRAKSRSNAEKRHHHPGSDNNNTPLVIRCQLGGELKDVCSSCRGSGPLAGKSTRFGPVRREPPTDPTAGLKRGLLPGTLAVCRVSLRLWTGRDGGAIRHLLDQAWGSAPDFGGPSSPVWEYEATELLTFDLCIRCVRLNDGRRPLIS